MPRCASTNCWPAMPKRWPMAISSCAALPSIRGRCARVMHILPCKADAITVSCSPRRPSAQVRLSSLPNRVPAWTGTRSAKPSSGSIVLREQLGTIAARFFGDATRNLSVTGVTGTNGKTSTVQLLAQSLNHLARRAATIGTLGAGLPGAIDRAERTTPDAIHLQRLMAGFLDQGATDVAMEVSSHALEQGRVNGDPFPPCRVHQPDPRSSRLPRQHAGLRGGEAKTVCHAGTRGRHHQYATIRSDDRWPRPCRRACSCISYGIAT